MDNTINKLLQFLFITVIFVSTVECQRLPFYLKASTPEYIQPDTDFEVSLLLRIFDVNADEIVLHILTPDAVELKAVNLNGTQKFFSLNKSGRFKKSYDLRFNLKDSIYNYEAFLNIGLTLISSRYESSQIDFKVDYIRNNSIIRTYGSNDFGSYNKAIQKVNLNFYKPSKIAGKSILLNNNSELKLSFNYNTEISRFLVEFWGRFENPSNHFLSFIYGSGKDTLVSIDINQKKILSVSNIDEISFIKECFISKNAWYHFSVFIDMNKGVADIYVNDQKALTINIGNVFSDNNFEVLLNKLNNGRIEIDQLKIWEFKNTARLSLANKNYENYFADSSKVLLNLSFNDENRIRNFYSSSVSSFLKGITFKNSTAPIFSRAPELNVHLYKDFYEIEWKNISKKEADFFELEKSVDGSNFKKIFETFASDDPEKIYFYTDHKDLSSEIVYYRIKQINKDRSEVYSTSLKIGQGELKLFNLGQNYPNPFNPQTSISIEMLEAVDVDIYVYDIVGEKVAILNKGVLSQGIHTFSFDGSNLPSGIYFCEAKSEKFTDVRKMILAK